MEKKLRRKIRLSLSFTEIFYNGCFASANFLSVFLQSLGIGAGQIGISSERYGASPFFVGITYR